MKNVLTYEFLALWVKVSILTLDFENFQNGSYFSNNSISIIYLNTLLVMISSLKVDSGGHCSNFKLCMHVYKFR